MMKKLIPFCFLLLFVNLSAFKSFKKESYIVDTERSSITWTAKKVLGKHNGFVKLSSGNLVMDGNSLLSGSFVMNMNTIAAIDADEASNKRLTDHLKSPDFFSVTTSPVSTFRIVKVRPGGSGVVNISGNLTIKGITHPVNFSATITKQNNIVTAVAKSIKIDRTKYDIKYRSANFFGDLGDKAIENEFELSVTLVGRVPVS